MVGISLDKASVTYCYNGGNVENKGTGTCTAGIVARNTVGAGSEEVGVAGQGSIVQYCYNSGNITSNGTFVGGLCGQNRKYCTMKNLYESNTAIIKSKGTTTANNIGKTPNYAGKLVGGDVYYNENNKIDATYVKDNYVEALPNIYYVVNRCNAGNSMHWSNSNVNEPTLLWEK